MCEKDTFDGEFVSVKFKSLDEAVGRTPLVSLRRLCSVEHASVCVKIESQNPGGSVKDRAAQAIISAAEADGRLCKDKTLIDASSGNTGIAYAMFCAARGYSCEICLPANASYERKVLIKRYRQL